MARGKTTWKDVWKEVVIFATAIAVAAAAWILISGLNRRAREKAQMEMERQRMLAAESEAKREKLRIEREEKERVERVRREKELTEKKAREVCDAAFGDEIPREAFAGFVSQLIYNRKLNAWRPPAVKKQSAPSSLKTMKNNSTISKTTIGGRKTAGEYHGTTSTWVGGHYLSRTHYRAKVYTHWKELAALREEMEAERKRSVAVPAPGKPKIVVSDDEVERTLAKAKLSFKVVKP